MNRGYVTGSGLVAANGFGVDDFWDNVLSERSGVSEVQQLDVSEYPSERAGEIDPSRVGGNRNHNRALSLLKKTTDEALSRAGLSRADLPVEKTALFLGTAHGPLNVWESWYREDNKPSDEPYSLEELSTRISDDLSIHHQGTTVSTACTSSTIALGLALKSLRNGRSEVAIVGGIDVLSEFVFAGFSSLKALTQNKNRPFDRDRDGLVLGEGAGILILESDEHARRRGVDPSIELTGFSTTADAQNFTAPDFGGQGTHRCMKNALDDANRAPGEVSYLNAHGTGTPHNDRAECRAVKKTFGEHAKQLPISSIKPLVGHTSGACGVIEAVLCSQAIQSDTIPSTVNFRRPEEEFPFDFVSEGPRSQDVEVVLSINAAFGGSNACLVFESV